MVAGELLALFRNEVMDTEMPYLWSDEEAYIYLSDAYTMLVRFLGGTSDATTAAVTDVSYAANASEISLHASVLRIVRAFNSAGDEISVIENTDFPLVRDSAGKVSLLKAGSETGAQILYLVMGADNRKAKLHPKPTGTGTLKLHVRRVPINTALTAVSTLDDLQPEHHIHLIKWMKSLAYRKQDSETYDMEKALLNENAFLQYASQAVYELTRLHRKSKASLRSNQDLKNPMLQAAASRMYQANLPSQAPPEGR
jgi:hypothetical protein